MNVSAPSSRKGLRAHCADIIRIRHCDKWDEPLYVLHCVTRCRYSIVDYPRRIILLMVLIIDANRVRRVTRQE
jgi:hypothetical protein